MPEDDRFLKTGWAFRAATRHLVDHNDVPRAAESAAKGVRNMGKDNASLLRDCVPFVQVLISADVCQQDLLSDGASARARAELFISRLLNSHQELCVLSVIDAMSETLEQALAGEVSRDEKECTQTLFENIAAALVKRGMAASQDEACSSDGCSAKKWTAGLSVVSKQAAAHALPALLSIATQPDKKLPPMRRMVKPKPNFPAEGLHEPVN